MNQILSRVPTEKSMQLLDLVIEGKPFFQISDDDLDINIENHQFLDRAIIRWHYQYQDELGLLQAGSIESFTISIGFQKEAVLTCTGSDLPEIELILFSAKQELIKKIPSKA
ncbi:MAG: hypothetical protein PHC86_00190 [Eubacteriales bacterium]|nr:hypothetical protein [Eubacteriales bacterium]